MGGLVLETNMTEILNRIEEQNKIEKEEVKQKQDEQIEPSNKCQLVNCFITQKKINLKPKISF
jgi:hypothetical protein